MAKQTQRSTFTVCPNPRLDDTAADFRPEDLISNSSSSPIESIDGIPIIEFLTRFAQTNALGMLEPHADWNTLMASPAQEIIGSANSFSGGATFYPGDNMTILFKDGEEYLTWWLALYNTPGFTVGRRPG